MDSKKENSKEKEKEKINDNNNNKILDLKKIVNIINKLFLKNNKYNDIINHNLLINKISQNYDNFYNKFSTNNEYNYYFSYKDKNITGYYTKFKRNINYINKKIENENSNNKINKKKVNIKDIYFLINSIFILKKYINENNHIYIRKYIKILFMLKYFEIIPTNIIKFIVEFYINIFTDLILNKPHYLNFIEDLIEGMIQFPNNDIFIPIINLFEEYFVNNLDMKIIINNSNIWQKLLCFKMIVNFKDNSNIIIEENNHNFEFIYRFLVNVYKYNLSINFLYEHIYKQSTIDLNYYVNATKFLSFLFKEEEKNKKNYCNFNIKNGFYIPKDNPLILEKIKFKENEFSLIFSFRIINNEIETETKSNDDIIIFNLSNNINNNVILKFIVNKDSSIKIIHGNKEWKIDKINIMKNKDYLVCLTQSYSSYKSTKLFFFINEINNDNKENNKSVKKNVIINPKNIKNIKTKKDTIKYNTFDIQSPYPYFDSEMVLELGKSNFNGIIGDFIIINKKLNENDIFNLFNLNGYYSYYIESINDKYDLINKYDNFYLDNKGSFAFFKKLNFNCILKILSYKLNSSFIKDKTELKIENFGFLKHKKNATIKVFDLKYSIDIFYNKNGIEFLIFQLHNIFNYIINNKNKNSYLFNKYLYQTLQLFYDIMIVIDDENTSRRKNESLKFSYFILSLLIILYKIKKKESNIQLNNEIYDLLLKYIDFYNLHNYYNHRNIILSILLDDSLFDQSKVFKEGTIFIYLMSIIKNNLNKDKDIINKDILLKILNLDYILESKEYHHKLYMKLILSLLLIENNKNILETIIKNIIFCNNEIKLYHYLKYIYINLESLKEKLINEKKFFSFIKRYSKKQTNYIHCKYCFNSLFLIFLIKGQLFSEEEKNDNKKKDFNINDSIKDREFLIKFKVGLIKYEFINCFNLNNDLKLKFIKNNKYLYNNDNNNNDKNNLNQKSFIKLNEMDLLKNIKTDDTLILKYDSIINNIYFIYNIYYENKNNKSLNIDNNNEEEEQIKNIFLIFKFFWEELINNNNNNNKKIELLNKLLILKGTETFFRIYLSYDYNTSINILHKIINLSINKIKHPFYFNYIEIDEKIDKYNNINNEKIKTEITEKIIIEIDKIIDNKEIICQNRKYLLIIINEIVKNYMKLQNNIEKYFLIYLRGLTDKKFFNKKILYKAKGEYYNLLELALNILFNISKINNYSKNDCDLIYQFVILENNKSIFYLIDEQFINDNKANIINNKKEIDFSNIIYCIYFLIYFMEIKNNLKLPENNSNNNNAKLNQDNSKEENNLLVFINVIISVIFYNSREIFKLLNSKKGFKSNIPKINIPNLEIYNSLFNYYSSNVKKYFTFEEFENYYKEIKISNLKSKSINIKDPKNKKKSLFLKNKKEFNKTNSVDKSGKKPNNFIVEIFNKNNDDKDENIFSNKIIENYISGNKQLELDNNKKNENKKNNTFLHNSISSFSRKKQLKDTPININDTINKEEPKIKDIDKNEDKENNNNNDNNNIKINDNQINDDNNNNNKINDNKINDNQINDDNNSSNSEESSEEEDEDELNKLDSNIKSNKNEENNKNEEKNNNEENKDKDKGEKEEDKDLETINISKLSTSNDISKNNQNNSIFSNISSNSTLSKTNSIVDDEPNNNNNLDNNNLKKTQEFNIKKLIEELNIPVVYFEKLINCNQLYFTKNLVNPKVNFLWKIFAYSFSDIIFNNKNFIKLSKSFKIYSKDLILESSSNEEKKYHLNYPTKIKNFICNDYYRPFLKPDMKFFNRESIKISHEYIPEKIIEKIRLENKLSNMKFVKFIPINEKDKDLKYFYCENVSYKGSILGKMYILDSFLIFANKTYKNFKKNKSGLMFFLYSKEDINKYKDIQKIIICYYHEIKEIILRRFCLKNIGYEIFLKDGRSYLFNFFKTEQINDFNNCILSKSKDILINDPINYFEKKDYKTKFKKGEINNFQYLLLVNKFSTRTFNNNSQYLVFPIIYMNIAKNILRNLSKAVCLNKDDSEVDIVKYRMNYDVMKCYYNNHYSTSAYILYYLVRLIPYTYLQIDFQSGKFDVPERIFSTYNNYSTALNTSSENRELIPEFYHHYEFCINLNYNYIGKMKKSSILINNFNSNKYKNSVEFIINHRRTFDNVNIVPWINNIFGYNQINDSKELMNIFPLYSYEQFNDYDKEINKIKEKLKNKENMYIEIYNHIRSKLAILDLGITPVQLFKVAHPERPKTINNNLLIDLNSSIKSNSSNLSNILNTSNCSNSNNNNDSSIIKKEKMEKEKNNEKKIKELFNPIKSFILSQKSEKYNIILNNQTMNIFFIFKNTIIIYSIFNYSKIYNNNEPQIEYPVKLNLKNDIIQLDSTYSTFSKNLCCELMPGFYCVCRNENRTIKFINHNEKYIFSYLWYCIITAIEPYNHNITYTNYYSDYKWKIYLGDEEGTLCILDCNFKYFFKNNEIKMTSMKITKKIKTLKNYINNILYNERLNIVVASSENGDISINNAFSLEILNYITIGSHYFINNIKISFYDLLYVNYYNYNNNKYYIKCFTLNGIKVTKIKSEKKIINFFINDNVNIFYEDKTIDKCSLYDFKEKKLLENNKQINNKSNNLLENEIPIKEDYYSDEENENSKDNDSDDLSTKLIHCNYCNKIKKLINIYDNNEMSLENL